jgi:hypothetical protein
MKNVVENYTNRNILMSWKKTACHCRCALYVSVPRMKSWTPASHSTLQHGTTVPKLSWLLSSAFSGQRPSPGLNVTPFPPSLKPSGHSAGVCLHLLPPGLCWMDTAMSHLPPAFPAQWLLHESPRPAWRQARAFVWGWCKAGHSAVQPPLLRARVALVWLSIQTEASN